MSIYSIIAVLLQIIQAERKNNTRYTLLAKLTEKMSREIVVATLLEKQTEKSNCYTVRKADRQ